MSVADSRAEPEAALRRQGTYKERAMEVTWAILFLVFVFLLCVVPLIGLLLEHSPHGPL